MKYDLKRSAEMREEAKKFRRREALIVALGFESYESGLECVCEEMRSAGFSISEIQATQHWGFRNCVNFAEQGCYDENGNIVTVENPVEKVENMEG